MDTPAPAPMRHDKLYVLAQCAGWSGFTLAYTGLAQLNKGMVVRLDPKYFFRANRRQIINFFWIDKIEPWFSGGLLMGLKGGAKVELSRGKLHDT